MILMKLIMSLGNFTGILNAGYQLIILEDDSETPLSAEPTGMSALTIVALIAAMVLVTVTMIGLLSKRSELKNRLLLLREKANIPDKKVPWNLSSIRSEIGDLEADLVSEMLG